jgi:branched-chain amino acid transport system permease protein
MGVAERAVDLSVIFSAQLLASVLVLASLYALVAIGLNLVYGTMRLLNVAHGELVMLGGYVAYWAFAQWAISPLLAALAAMAIAAAGGALLYIAVIRRLFRSPSLLARIESNSLLLFFGISIIIQNVTALAFTANSRGYSYLDQVIEIGDARITANRLATLAVAGVASLACALFFRYARSGMAMRAIIQQRDAAALVGIDVDRINVQVFALGFALAALAGALISMSQQISPFMGFPFTVSGFVIIILGGLGNLTGSIFGSLILAAVEVYGVTLISPSFRSILVYGVFIAALLLRPQGLLGRSIKAR